MSEARIVGCNQMVVVCKPCQQRLKHPRRRRKTVQQKKGGSVFRPRSSVEDGESTDAYCAKNTCCSIALSVFWAFMPRVVASTIARVASIRTIDFIVFIPPPILVGVHAFCLMAVMPRRSSIT